MCSKTGNHKNLYNLIIHAREDFWPGDKKCVELERSRFLEYTEKHLSDKFKSLDKSAIDELKNLPTLFAVENEKTETRIGRITGIECCSKNLYISYEFDKEKSFLIKGALKSPELGLRLRDDELYRTHWAIKEVNMEEFLEKRSKTLEGVLENIKHDLDKNDHTKFTVLYAYNASGKTRLSKLFNDQYEPQARFNDKHEPQVLFYSAFTEDLFSWDNQNYVLKFDKKHWIFKVIEDEGLDKNIIDKFKKFMSSKLEPAFDFPKSQITFGIPRGDNTANENIKISRGEERIFIWSIFYMISDSFIDRLNDDSNDSQSSDHLKYIVIDDPVSSMDDTRIITVALDLVALIMKSKKPLKFLITTHNSLFFNMLLNVQLKGLEKKKEKKVTKETYILSKSGTDITLKKQKKGSPFAYHHAVIEEIQIAIKKNDIKKYHFNIFRALLEKTANFLGYPYWKDCLKGIENSNIFIKTIDHYSHNDLSDLEYWDIANDEKEEFVKVFNFFMEKYDWYMKSNDESTP